MKVTLDHIDDVAEHIKMFWFRPERRVQYTAGQFTELYLPHNNPDSRGERRWFTLSSSPTEPLLAITTRFTRGRSSTFKEAFQHLPIGAEVNLADPMGDFVLPKDATIPLLFAAVGMGITPVRSMIKSLVDSGEKRAVTLLHAVPTESQFVFQDVFGAYDLAFTPLVREPGPSWKGETGTITAERVIAALDGDLHTLVYLSGPEETTERIAKKVAAYGLPQHRIITDFFPGYPED